MTLAGSKQPGVDGVARLPRESLGGSQIWLPASQGQVPEGMRPENILDWIAFILLLTGAFAWGYHVTGVNIFSVTLGRIWGPLDDLVCVLIAASGMYWMRRVFPRYRGMLRREQSRRAL